MPGASAGHKFYFMLAKIKRFNIKDTRTLEPAKTIRGRFVLLKVFKNNAGYNRTAVSMGKKISSLASSRNKIKRAVFDAIEESGFLTQKGESDLLVIPLPSCTRETKPSRAIIRELKELILKL